MSKTDLILRLHEEIAKAERRQLPNATKPSGCMRGLLKAIEIIENYKESD
ncbi:hypothetical protein [Bacillus phage vB_BanS-Thrax4]|jgi:hypothetical protein|nr:hypothetical protein [Bacillus phage vB_BanS-Thrax4]